MTAEREGYFLVVISTNSDTSLFFPSSQNPASEKKAVASMVGCLIQATALSASHVHIQPCF